MSPLTLKEFDDFPDYEDGSFDAGLLALAMVAEPNEQFSLEAIAEVCGCSYEWIRLLERQALRKLRRALRHNTGSLSFEEEQDLKDELFAACAAKDRDLGPNRVGPQNTDT
jgi:hypothetical protein